MSVRRMHTRWVATGSGATIAQLIHAARSLRTERGRDVATWLERRFVGYNLELTRSNLRLIGHGYNGTLNEYDLDRFINVSRENCSRVFARGVRLDREVLEA